MSDTAAESASTGAPVTATTDATPTTSLTLYGSNASAGEYFEHDDIKLYYELYGQGPPLLLIHGNGASIWWMKHQIAFFSQYYRVIVMDSRCHGRSGDVKDDLTFEAMTDDLAALLEHLKTGPVRVLGWSDGGIQALLLGIRRADLVTKIAAMSANLSPEGLAPEMKNQISLRGKEDDVLAPTRARRVAALNRDEPNIEPDALAAIMAPTLVMASDNDIVTAEHTLEIYQHLRNGQLAIFSDATHMLPVDDPVGFNNVVDRFLRTPFTKRDRILDVLRSSQQMKREFVAECKGR